MRVDATLTQCVQFGGILRPWPIRRALLRVGNNLRNICRTNDASRLQQRDGRTIDRFPPLVLSVVRCWLAAKAQYFGGFFDGCVYVYVAAMLYSLSALGPRRRMPRFDFCPFLRSLYSPALPPSLLH